ncbi:MAG: hypothetical protein NTW64_01590 [Candidatus Omnitrophica bacterium]|nr:hypothetical protein [Candidatus Omnitrophota bacterium]
MALDKKVKLFTVLLSGFRHRWFVYFRSRYTIRSLLSRKGKCLACGRCCLLNIPWCRYLNNNKCQLGKRKPFFCKIFPIDKKDKILSGVSEECGYYWEERE